jgi:hypothetical protein
VGQVSLARFVNDIQDERDCEEHKRDQHRPICRWMTEAADYKHDESDNDETDPAYYLQVIVIIRSCREPFIYTLLELASSWKLAWGRRCCDCWCEGDLAAGGAELVAQSDHPTRIHDGEIARRTGESELSRPSRCEFPGGRDAEHTQYGDQRQCGDEHCVWPLATDVRDERHVCR